MREKEGTGMRCSGRELLSTERAHNSPGGIDWRHLLRDSSKVGGARGNDPAERGNEEI